MRKIKLIVDSASDLGKEYYERLNIDVVPIYVILGETTYQDYYEINTEQIYAFTEETGIYPKTAAASPALVYDVFKKYYDEGYDILYIGIGSKISATFSVAQAAAKEIDPKGERFFLVDSGNVSVGIGILVLKAQKLKEKGLSAKEIQTQIQEMANKVNTQFVINTLEYLQKGGRCSALVRYAAATLRLKPIIKIINGALEVIKKPIGYKRALKAMLLDSENDFERVDPDIAYVAYSTPSRHVDSVVKKLKKIGFKKVLTATTGATISTHCGPETIGIVYIYK
ncbi:MAG TPA: DegV family protein [Acholeplasmataceae bacterium]|jgi:DegV family protein with EDD domain|nr:DegV family protein [Acholeplasmataceae bacterium]